MGKFIDLTGRKFGRLTVLERSKNNKWNTPLWICVCDCGKQVVVAGNSLRSGNTKSCGCFKLENTINIKTKHSGSKRSEYGIWVLMKGRCYNENNERFPDYGGRGIAVCERWKDNFQNFLEDMGDRPSKSHSLERIDNDGNYEPSNCKWATDREQAKNQRIRKDNTSNYKGISWRKTDHKWQVRIQTDNIRRVIGFFENLQDAIRAREEAEKQYWGKSS